VTARDDSAYRLEVARGLLSKAQDALGRAEWHTAELFARGAVEHAAKALLACFTGVPRTHEPAEVLRVALAQPAFPPELRADAQALSTPAASYGLARHLELSYGDERRRIPPWALVTESGARSAVDVAGRLADLADRCGKSLFRS
jgi:HEPN domain-containing protein